MKNLKVTAIALLISTSCLFAADIVPDIPAKTIRHQVVELFDSPDFNVDSETVVHITFTFNTEGEIIVLKVDSKNSDVLRYVRKYMNHKKVEIPGEPNREFVIPLRIQK